MKLGEVGVTIEIDEARDPIGPDAETSSRRASRKGAVAMSLDRYLQLLDWVGRTIRSDKRGSIPAGLDSILSRVGLTQKSPLRQLWSFGAPRGENFLSPSEVPIMASSLVQPTI